MSKLNIKRAIENIRATTTVYTPLVEMIVNAIEAIDEAHLECGEVSVRAIREAQAELDGSHPDISGFEIRDNGIGFTDEHRNSFDTLYTDTKISDGGKGFGRFLCLKYFDDLRIRSIFRDSNVFKKRSFSMGKKQDIIVDEKISISEQTTSGTAVYLTDLKNSRALDKKLSTVAKNLVERLLPYFISEGYKCPRIVLSEHDGSSGICLNDYVSNEVSASIQEIPLQFDRFTLYALQGKENFRVRVFKIFSPRNQRSRISLVAHNRKVESSMLHSYVPEFEEEFLEKYSDGDMERERNYIVRAYVFGEYLDNHVSLERGAFDFNAKDDLLFGIGQTDIERQAAKIAEGVLGSEMVYRKEKKLERVQSYVDHEAPWHKEVLNGADLSRLPYNPSDEDIERCLHDEKFAQERSIKQDVERLLADPDVELFEENVSEIVSRISDNSKSDLIHYIVARKEIIHLFGKSLEVSSSGAYSSEGAVHDIIFPRKGDSERTPFENHHLWLVDERLNYTSYVSSDLALSVNNAERPDLLVYNRRVLFRGDNQPSNPITVFEFKKPRRDDFVNPSSREDPVQQIVRYVNDIKDGKYVTPEGRSIRVAENTPFYGFVVCDLTPKVESWLQREKDFRPMPDRLGWFQWMGNINLYIEVISWDKILTDAKIRNKIFFKKLGI